MYHGDIRLGESIDVKFSTRQFTTGAPFLLAGSPVISAYVGNNTTQITAGITLTANFDGLAGLNNVRVVATSGNGYATASNYTLVITTGTVDSVSVVGECVGSFSIENRSALMPTTAARTLDVSATGEGDANIAQLLGSAIATPTVAGVLEVDVTHWRGTAVLVPVLAGQPTVDANYFTGVTQTSGDLLAAIVAFAGLVPSADQNADAYLDRADAIEVGLTPRQAHRLEAAAAAGKLSGAATALVRIRNAVQDSKDRVIATVDASGNRSAITTDVT